MIDIDLKKLSFNIKDRLYLKQTSTNTRLTMKNSTASFMAGMALCTCGYSLSFAQSAYTVLEGNHSIVPKEVSPGVWEEGWLSIASDLQVSGDLYLGLTGSSSNGLSVFYTESGSVYRVISRAARTGTAFRWEEGGSGVPKMELGANNTLTLYNTTGSPVITFSPATGTINTTGAIKASGGIRLADNTLITGAESLRSSKLYNDEGESVLEVMAGYSMSFGYDNYVGGYNSVAIGGSGNFISSDFSTIIGSLSSFADGGQGAIVGGTMNSVSGAYVFVGGGRENGASGRSSAVLGGAWNTTFAFASAIVGGEHNVLFGERSAIVGGIYNEAQSAYSLVIGSNNVVQGNPNDWIATDDIFVIGNGRPDNWGDNSGRSNALAVHKNGATRASGLIESKQGVRVPPGGDISMGTFTAGRNPAEMGVGLRYSGE